MSTAELCAAVVLVGSKNGRLVIGSGTLVAEQKSGSLVLKLKIQCYRWGNWFVLEFTFVMCKQHYNTIVFFFAWSILVGYFYFYF